MRLFHRAVPLVALLAAVSAAACSNPVGESGQHERPAGIQVEHGGTTVLRLAGQQITGSLTVPAGTGLGPLTVRFLDGSGNAITPPAGYYLRVTVTSTATAEWVQTPPGEFGGVLRGKAAGTTPILFEWMHGAVGGGHADYSTRGLLNVVVTP